MISGGRSVSILSMKLAIFVEWCKGEPTHRSACASTVPLTATSAVAVRHCVEVACRRPFQQLWTVERSGSQVFLAVASGMRTYNCSPNSGLDCFPKVSYEYALFL